MEEIKLTPEQMAQYMAIVDEAENLRTLTEAEKEMLIRDIMEKPFLDLLCDVAFKYVFSSDMDSLLMLLNDFLPEKIVEISTAPNELVSPVVEDKKPVIDILAKTGDGRQIIIEMQQEKYKDICPRLYYYGSKLLSQQLKKGKQYHQLVPVIVICFANFKLEHKGCPEEQLVYEYQHRETKGEDVFTNLHSTYICELPRLAEKALKDMNPIENWFFILRNSRNFATKPAGLDPRYDHIIEAAKTNLVPDKERTQYLRAMISEYDKEQISEAYYEDGYAAGMKVGEQNANIQTAKAMLAEGFDIALISRLTKLSTEEVEAIKTGTN